MFVTVIVCTYNRCSVLANALNSVAASVLPPSIEWEVLVVDNNSTDQTRKVVDEFCRRYPGRFLYLFEATQGKSYALNAAIQEARGEVLAFMDDDVTVDPDWLWNLTAALQNGEWAGAGGRVIPVWSCSPPSWLVVGGPHALGPFVEFDRGSEAGPLNEPPLGANMAFRRDVFKKWGGFRTDLGPSGSTLLRNDDTEFGRRLLAAGERLRYEPSAVMRHPVPEYRTQKSYLLAWWFGKGCSDALESRIPRQANWFRSRSSLVLFRRLLGWALRWMIAIDSKRRFSCKLNVWNISGQIVGCYQASAHSKRQSRAFIDDQR